MPACPHRHGLRRHSQDRAGQGPGPAPKPSASWINQGTLKSRDAQAVAKCRFTTKTVEQALQVGQCPLTTSCLTLLPSNKTL